MSKKFFSLIKGDSFHVAPNTKIIPGDAISTLVSAQEVLDKVKLDAEEYKKAVVLEADKIKEKEYQAGFEQGYSEWIEKIAELEEEIKKVRKDTENVILPIAIKAAKKILGREVEISKDTVVDIISSSLKSVATHKKIKIYVNKKELEIMERHKERLKKIFENLESLSILSQDEIKPGGCIIETEGGIINAQLENQWMILENAFKKILQTKHVSPKELVEAKLPSQIQAPKVQKEPQKQPPIAPAAATKVKKEEPPSTPSKAKKEEVEEEEEDWEEDEDDWEDDEDWEDEESEK